MYQEVTLKASPEAISFVGWLIVGGILASIGINYNNIISGIPNGIPNPSIIQSMVNKYCENKFMRISGFVCKYLCSISCNKVESGGIVRLVKEIVFCGGEQVQ